MPQVDRYTSMRCCTNRSFFVFVLGLMTQRSTDSHVVRWLCLYIRLELLLQWHLQRRREREWRVHSQPCCHAHGVSETDRNHHGLVVDQEFLGRRLGREWLHPRRDEIERRGSLRMGPCSPRGYRLRWRCR